MFRCSTTELQETLGSGVIELGSGGICPTHCRDRDVEWWHCRTSRRKDDEFSAMEMNEEIYRKSNEKDGKHSPLQMNGTFPSVQ